MYELAMMKQFRARSLENSIESSVCIIKKSTAMKLPKVSCVKARKKNVYDLHETFSVHKEHRTGAFGS